jgi:hypothetical protein
MKNNKLQDSHKKTLLTMIAVCAGFIIAVLNIILAAYFYDFWFVKIFVHMGGVIWVVVGIIVLYEIYKRKIKKVGDKNE